MNSPKFKLGDTVYYNSQKRTVTGVRFAFHTNGRGWSYFISIARDLKEMPEDWFTMTEYDTNEVQEDKLFSPAEHIAERRKSIQDQETNLKNLEQDLKSRGLIN